jgi:hypothetical protein
MPTLLVSNGYAQALNGLGKIAPFAKLSQKRVTKATRAALRLHYSNSEIEVSCTALFLNNAWHGLCSINQKPFEYVISNGGRSSVG